MHRLPGAPPTDPDVKISLIRFLGTEQFGYRTGTTPFGAQLCCPRRQLCGIVCSALFRSQVTRFAASECLPWFSSSERYTRLHLPFSGSAWAVLPRLPGQQHFADRRYYVPLRLPNVRLRFVRYSLSSPDTLPIPLFVFRFRLADRRKSFPCRRREFCIRYPPYRFYTGKRPALPSSRAAPVNT